MEASRKAEIEDDVLDKRLDISQDSCLKLRPELFLILSSVGVESRLL